MATRLPATGTTTRNSWQSRSPLAGAIIMIKLMLTDLKTEEPRTAFHVCVTPSHAMPAEHFFEMSPCDVTVWPDRCVQTRTRDSARCHMPDGVVHAAADSMTVTGCGQVSEPTPD